VAFMLVHFFCLLEFKFRFEFFLFESFSRKPKPKYLIPKPFSSPYPIPFSFIPPARVAQLPRRPAQPL
jgi:hypothetical protein